MLCAAIDIGSNTTRVLVAEPVDGQLKKVMEQRAYTRINKALDADGAICAEKIDEVCEVVATQVRLAKELGAEEIRAVATAAVREASNGEEVAAAIGEAAGVPVEILSDEEEGRLSFIGATKTLGHPVEGRVGVVDVGGGSTEVILGTVPGGRRAGALLAGRLRRARRRADLLRPALGGRDPQGSRPHRRHLRRGRDRASRPRPSPSAAAPPRCAAWSAPCSSTRPWSGASASSAAIPRPRSRAASSSTRNGSASSPPACCCWRRSPSCSASRCRSARAACARASSSTCSTAAPTAPAVRLAA